MKTPFLLGLNQSRNVNSFPFGGLNSIKNKFRISNNNFESNKTKFINELKKISYHYGFKYKSSKIVYEGDDEIIIHMEQFCKSNNMDDLFKDSYIVLE